MAIENKHLPTNPPLLTEGVALPVRKRSSTDTRQMARGDSKRTHMNESEQPVDGPSPELVFDDVLDLILQWGQSPTVLSAVYFLFGHPWKDLILLYCAKKQLGEGRLCGGGPDFTEEELATTIFQYRSYTGDQNLQVREKLEQLLGSSVDCIIGDMKGMSLNKGSENNEALPGRRESKESEDSTVSSEPICGEWVDYLASKITRVYGYRWQAEEDSEYWLQIVEAYQLLVGECLASDMVEHCTEDDLNDIQRILLPTNPSCPKSKRLPWGRDISGFEFHKIPQLQPTKGKSP